MARRSGPPSRKPKRPQAARSTRPHQAQAARSDAPAGTAPAGTAPVSSEAEEPQALVATVLFDSLDVGEGDATVRFAGRRISQGLPKAGDSFTHDEQIEGVVPGTGPASVTAWVYGVKAGEWSVDAQLIPRTAGAGGTSYRKAASPRPLQAATWSWRRWRLSPAPSTPIKTRWAPLAQLARQPAVVHGLYTALAVVGFVVALVLQSAILSGQSVQADRPLVASILASVAGLIGAKVWYAVLHPDESLIRGGWAVDGFLIVAPLVAAFILYEWELPIGRVLDATAPGIFFAVALGRIGCFLTGCCAGRCSASSWAIWSSDQRVGARRLPAQLWESAAGLALGIVTLVIVVSGGLPVRGGVFIAGFAVYAVVRQALLRVRAERRRSYRTLPLTAVAAGLVVVVILALSLAQGA